MGARLWGLSSNRLGSRSCWPRGCLGPRHPDGADVVLCIEKALAQSWVSREYDYINALHTGWRPGDLKEYNALIHCFGQNPELRVNSTKSIIAHLLGAAGTVEAVAPLQLHPAKLHFLVNGSTHI
ncbi:3-oxoacyl-[acyl-carrier-protein] synthase II, chloroplastic-like [Prunus avium]|uniref:beta-ketoacyl-[acyl-carrier-protein] synthase I n=1 Tax=Prunus avium TaxID=42229 RepID=A0A6P5RI59_PRUAV|nr:3-oxoacyl-[acyl-carrier-protein] synthase II, chloroplastic-like [Prunus avium]XP_021804531.1 3-oxoacyl-[acyl-carrier-protein] synthase II, chloroplastic-like [Prunus avium]